MRSATTSTSSSVRGAEEEERVEERREETDKLFAIEIVVCAGGGSREDTPDQGILLSGVTHATALQNILGMYCGVLMHLGLCLVLSL